MRRSFRGNKNKSLATKEFRANERISVPEMLVIDENGVSLGVISREQALKEATERGFDLVEVSPKNNPPICKLMDYGSFKYQQEKQERKQKAHQKTTELKTVKISNRIGQHDSEIRVNQAVKFLSAGDKVKIELQLRGRENQHSDLARDNIKKVIDAIGEKMPGKVLKVEQDVKKLGNKLSAIIGL